MLRENRDKLLNLFSMLFLSHSLSAPWAVTSVVEIVQTADFRRPLRSATDAESRSHHASDTRLLTIQYSESPTYECHYELGGSYLFNNPVASVPLPGVLSEDNIVMVGSF